MRFLPMVAAENGEQVNFLNVAREVAVSRDIVRAYYQILEDTLLGFFLLPFAGAERTKIARHPKFYFFDCGVARALQKKLSVELADKTEEFGKAFEHFFISEIVRLNEYRRLDLELSFYRTRAGAEVDCVIKAPDGQLWAIEIKSTQNPAPVHCGGLRSFKEAFPQARCQLACRVSRPVKLGEFIALPWQEALEQMSTFS